MPRPFRDFADRESTIQGFLVDENPETPNPETPDLCHLSSYDRRLWTNREIALRDFAGHNLLVLRLRTPNPDPLGSCATCPLLDRRLRLIREIATRDFAECGTLVLSIPESRNPDVQWTWVLLLLCSRVIFPAPSPRSDGPRDLAKLHGDHQPSILFL